MTFANGVLMSAPSFLWTESTKHQKVEATSFDETCEVKKATNFEKLHEMKKEKKKEHLRLAIASHFRRQDMIHCTRVITDLALIIYVQIMSKSLFVGSGPKIKFVQRDVFDIPSRLF